MIDALQAESCAMHGRRPTASADARSKPLAVRVCGEVIRVTGMPRTRHAQVAALLRPFLVRPGEGAAMAPDISVHLEPAPAERGWRVYVNGTFFTLTFDSATFVPFIEWLIVSRAVERSTAYVAYHAASLAWRRRAVILVAPSGSGKTTLTAGLASRGWKPLADDLTIVDAAASAIHPFRRCFHTDPFSRAVLADAIPIRAPVASLEDFVRPIRWGPDRSQPAWVVIMRRDADEPASMRPVTRAEAAAALFTSAIRNGAPRSETARLSAVIAGKIRGCWELNNSEIGATLDLLDSTLRDA